MTEKIPGQEFLPSKFKADDLETLKSQLVQAKDNFAAAEVLLGFLEENGFGADQQELREVAPGLSKKSLNDMQRELGRIARAN